MQYATQPSNEARPSAINIRDRDRAQRAIDRLPEPIAEPLEAVLGMAMLYVDLDDEQTWMFGRIRQAAEAMYDAQVSVSQCTICDAEKEI